MTTHNVVQRWSSTRVLGVEFVFVKLLIRKIKIDFAFDHNRKCHCPILRPLDRLSRISFSACCPPPPFEQFNAILLYSAWSTTPPDRFLCYTLNLNENTFTQLPSDLQELLAPITQALITVGGLFGVCVACVLHPVLEQLRVFLQDQILAENGVGFVKAGCFQALAQRFADTGQIGDRLLAHWLGHKITMFLRCARHCLFFSFVSVVCGSAQKINPHKKTFLFIFAQPNGWP